MKFKLLTEAFDYDQRAITDSDILITKLSDFIEDLSIIKHSEDHISAEDLSKLEEAVNILKEFNESYTRFARKQAFSHYAEKRGI